MTLTLQAVKADPEVRAFVRKADESLRATGVHRARHAARRHRSPHRAQHPVAAGASEREAELAAIAGYLHDLGNSINRLDHGHRLGAARP